VLRSIANIWDNFPSLGKEKGGVETPFEPKIPDFPPFSHSGTALVKRTMCRREAGARALGE
jgi:hypothetical protein